MNEHIPPSMLSIADTPVPLDELTYLGEGLSGTVYGMDELAIKVYKDDASETTDAGFLHYLHDHPAFPNLHAQSKQQVVMDRIQGYTFAQLRQTNSLPAKYLEQIEQIILDCYQQGIIPNDLHLNNLMIDQNNHVKIIDVGRFFHTKHPQQHQEDLRDQLDAIRYAAGFGFFSSSRRKKKRRYRSSSSGYNRKRYRSSSSGHHRRHHSSSSYPHRKRRRKYYSS